MTDSPEKQSNPADWPEVIRISIWLVQEHDNWQALAADFDIAGQGPSEVLALQNLQELVTDYLLDCAEEGLPFDQVLRPIPVGERLKLKGARLLAPLHRLRHRWVGREGLIFPTPDDHALRC